MKKGGRTFQKLSQFGGGVQNFLLERGDKPEKGGVGWGGGWCRNGELPLFILLYSSITLTVCGESKVSFITFRIF